MMQVINFEDPKFKDEMVRHLRAGRIIPIIGSGFTRGSRSSKGVVPSGKDMHTYMIEKLSGIFPSNTEKIERMNFSQVAGLYEKHVNLNVKHRYLEDCFTNVKIDDAKKGFLDLSWPYVYTLNIDDGIENASKYDLILPNEELNETYLEGKKLLFKLHGDVRDVLKYRASDKYIFSESQYLASLKTNIQLLNILKNDLLSNNVIYIGCSLESEVDILSNVFEVEHTDLKKIERNTYYVTHRAPDEIELSQLEDYGVNYIVIVEDYSSFYEGIIDLHLESKKLKQESLDDYLNLSLNLKNDNYEENINFVFDANITLSHIDKKRIEIPSFFIERELLGKVLTNIKTSNFQVIYGHRISGKTYMIYSLIKSIKDRDVYFFPSKLSLDFPTLKSLIQKEKSILLFDSNVLDESQVRYIINNMDLIKKNNTVVVLAINSSDKEIINIISSVNKSNIRIDLLKNKFLSKEINALNSKLSLLNIPQFNESKSLLDNIITIDNVLPSFERDFKSPKLVSPSREELVIMIILAVKESMPSSDLIRFDLTKEIGSFYNKVEPYIHYEYTSIFERADHSGSKIIPNAKYWILKTLGDFALNNKNHERVAEAYLYIASNLKRSIKSPQQFSKEIAKYIKFDVINDVFPRTEQGSVALISKIYDTLNKVLSTEPQYFHQRAKSKLWYYRNESSELIEALRSAKIAEHNLGLQKFDNEFKRTSLNHIKFTISLILGRLVVLNSFKDQELLKEAIHGYYIALMEKDNEQYVSYSLKNTKKYDYSNNREIADLRKLVEYISMNGSKITKDSKNEFNVILNMIQKLTPRFINSDKSKFQKKY